jgi:hypothetical protein
MSSPTAETTETTERVVGNRKQKVTLGQAFAEFWRHPSPWMILVTLVGATAARLLVGDWQLVDLVAPLAFVAMFPAIEWVVHVCVLHWRPRQIGRVRIDHLMASSHRAHHRDPRNVPLVFIPWQVVAGLMALTVAAPLWVAPTPGSGLTFMMTVAAVGMVYEWVHYLVHTDYKPRSRAYKAVWRHHRLHHFKNEHYWMTVTTAHTADKLFGTDPDPATVSTSPTAKKLHGLVD